MNTQDILVEAYGRIRQLVHQAAAELDQPRLTYRPEPGANSIAWLIWHLTRIQDDHVSEIAGVDQVWVTGDWAAALGMEPDPTNLGQGHGPDDVAAINPADPTALLGYHDEVMDRSVDYLAGVDDAELARIIDYSYTPPVSVGVRLVSVLSDNIQHAGQARYLRGIVDRIM
jgi:uncharacterized damage-inducible protein DinB